MKQTNYGNWVPGTLMNLLWGGTALFLAAVLFIRFLGGSGLMQGIFWRFSPSSQPWLSICRPAAVPFPSPGAM